MGNTDIRTPAPVVDLAGAVKFFDNGVRAVAGLDLTVTRGEVVAVLGRNGAGKSTTIGLLLGLMEPSAGRVELFGGSPEQAVRDGRVGAMLQEGRPLTRVTVRELLSFTARRYPCPLRVTETLELAGLTQLADRRVDRLSSGQAQRVRFALAMAGAPELIVLDEPTAALDVASRRAFWTAMRAYADRGNTVLFSTHYLEEADGQADRIVVIDRGRKRADGTSDAIKRGVGGALVACDLDDRGGAGLDLLPGVTSVEARGTRALLRSTDSDATVRALCELDLIHGLIVTPATLDDAFVALTSHAGDTGHDSDAMQPGTRERMAH
ncbi:ABC transporter ATP-binding protein [Streptomyces sp. NPDC052052]|uniref:ABC transporter ATP-binding protein n=1 Tax=Streptomyces sp. NPDC052052 TaxID=3154756 RepID=UPI00344258C1